ncbi:2-oxoglutarate dehydrogenase complex dihydrolipoyllysine-residue succinyltransferase [Tautonia rosea]|uniref:2-oxoglutarate dehydrogenase complex dihydrolipoyllysine-residue succinyltransferase n=1 Tax=Tautonia rosea TaxID=2728037 RepID=UPI0014757E6E|nr:2-oxoglutarate dehydrogenase complex dihydrolipoyllysine-residue succinyltransferase [Tautonia rosea]
MAAVEIKVPSAGESVTEGILSRWLKPDGAQIKSGEPLFEVETDKASTEVPAPADGVLKISVPEGETVEVGSTVGTIDPSGTPTEAPKAAKAPEAVKTAEPAKAEAAPSPSPAPSSSGNGPMAGTPSPSARRLAEEEKVDLASVEGSGRGGRITKGDVIGAVESRGSAPAPAAAPSAPAPSAAPRTGRQTRQRLPLIRQKIAQRLVHAQQTAAILTTFNEADMSAVMALRGKYKDAYKEKHGVNLGFMSFFVKATVEALKAFPAVNAQIDGNEIVYNNYYDIGVAVSTERGLMVPVIRDCDTLSFAGIEQTIAGFGKKARENKIAVDDLQGGTFTITNGGVFGSLLSTPILNPPQSGILGMHSIQKRPIAVGDQVVIRPMMYLALSYDHRIIDGREAVSFLVRIKECIENPERMMLEI